MSLNEADTCRVYVTPKLVDAGWEQPPHSLIEQQTFTDGRVEVRGTTIRRGEKRRADYLLPRGWPDSPLLPRNCHQSGSPGNPAGTPPHSTLYGDRHR